MFTMNLNQIKLRLRKIGGSHSVTIPSFLVEQFNMESGDSLLIEIKEHIKKE